MSGDLAAALLMGMLGLLGAAAIVGGAIAHFRVQQARMELLTASLIAGPRLYAAVLQTQERAMTYKSRARGARLES